MNQLAFVIHPTIKMESLGEKMLWLATLQRAMLDYLSPLKGPEWLHHRITARLWFNCKYHGKPPIGSFEWVCDNLDLCPTRIRNYVFNQPLSQTPNPNYYKSRYSEWFNFLFDDDNRAPRYAFRRDK